MYGRVGRSEFAGLPSEVQEIKLRNAIRIFHQHGVNPQVWIAPGHSFDAATVEILGRTRCAHYQRRLRSFSLPRPPRRDLDSSADGPAEKGPHRRLDSMFAL